MTIFAPWNARDHGAQGALTVAIFALVSLPVLL
jgi:hypothetical protein